MQQKVSDLRRRIAQQRQDQNSQQGQLYTSVNQKDYLSELQNIDLEKYSQNYLQEFMKNTGINLANTQEESQQLISDLKSITVQPEPVQAQNQTKEEAGQQGVLDQLSLIANERTAEEEQIGNIVVSQQPAPRVDANAELSLKTLTRMYAQLQGQINMQDTQIKMIPTLLGRVQQQETEIMTLKQLLLEQSKTLKQLSQCQYQNKLDIQTLANMLQKLKSERVASDAILKGTMPQTISDGSFGIKQAQTLPGTTFRGADQMPALLPRQIPAPQSMEHSNEPDRSQLDDDEEQLLKLLKDTNDQAMRFLEQ